MNDTQLIIVVLVIAIGSLAGIAYLLDARSKKKGTKPILPELGPIGLKFLWAIRIIIFAMLFCIVLYLLFKSIIFVWIAGVFMVAYMIVGRIGAFYRLSGK